MTQFSALILWTGSHLSYVVMELVSDHRTNFIFKFLTSNVLVFILHYTVAA